MNETVINVNARKNIKYIIWAIIAVLVIAIIASSSKSVPAGFVGVRTQFGAVSGGSLSAGLNFKIPFMQKIELMDTRIQKIEADAFAASKDLQIVTSKIAVNFSINPQQAGDLYKEVGINFKSVIIEPAVQEVVKMATAQYTAEELIAKRGEVSAKMTQFLSEKISKKGIIINDFNVLNFEFSQDFNKAIEQKQIAQQQALKAGQDLERIRIEAEQKIVQAKAEAESLKLQKQEITAEMLELRTIEAKLKAIEKWDGKLPQYNGGNAIPFIDVTK
jgi:regulator of protease activity HflC (stomatin/prohibitin superfamily)